MSNPKRKVTDLLPTEAILISSDADLKVLDEFEKAGMVWHSSRRKPTEYYPKQFPFYVRYDLSFEGIVLKFYPTDYEIVPATDFIPTESDEVEVSKFWKKLSEEKPHSYKTGHWDGKMSDTILFADLNGLFYVGKCYQGIMDGSEFCCFYDQNDFDVANVTHWAKIPSLF